MTTPTITLSTSPYARFWLIAYPPSGRGVTSHWPNPYTVTMNRASCIAKFVEQQRNIWNPDRPEASFTWKQWYARGYRCVRVKAVIA